jgi:hypothetical protein
MRSPLTYVGEEKRKVIAVYLATDNPCELNLRMVVGNILTSEIFDPS